MKLCKQGCMLTNNNKTSPCKCYGLFTSRKFFQPSHLVLFPVQCVANVFQYPNKDVTGFYFVAREPCCSLCFSKKKIIKTINYLHRISAQSTMLNSYQERAGFGYHCILQTARYNTAMIENRWDICFFIFLCED